MNESEVSRRESAADVAIINYFLDLSKIKKQYKNGKALDKNKSISKQSISLIIEVKSSSGVTNSSHVQTYKQY